MVNVKIAPALAKVATQGMYGAIPNRHPDDAIMSLRMQIEKAKLFSDPVSICKTDISGAFDHIHHSAIYDGLRLASHTSVTTDLVRMAICGQSHTTEINKTHTEDPIPQRTKTRLSTIPYFVQLRYGVLNNKPRNTLEDKALRIPHHR